MASTTYTGAASVTTAYAADDVYTLNIAPASITNITQQGADVVIATGSTFFTITGVTLAALATTNFVLQGGGSLAFGDGLAAATADAGTNTVTGSAFGDVLMGLGGADTIVGNGGDNLVFGGSALTDTIDGGDSITTSNGNDTIYGNFGDDTITAGVGADLVYGGLGEDEITVAPTAGQVATVFGGGSLNDTTDGADEITAGTTTAAVAGGVLAYGNAGGDVINIYANASSTVYGGLGDDQITLGATAAPANGDNLVVGGFDDADEITIVGNGDNTVYGGTGVTSTVDGDDQITITGGGNNSVYGNAGGDTVVITGAGDNSVYGGLGDDNVTLNGDGENLVIGGVDDTDSITINGDGNNTIYGGSAFASTNDLTDTITVTGDGNNLIYGNGGNDQIGVFGDGNNSIYGGVGDDVILVNGPLGASSALGDNLIQGGSGNNRISVSGTGGNTTIYGGNGETDSADLVTTIDLNVSGGTHSIYSNAGNDVIGATVVGGAEVNIFAGTGDDVVTFGAGSDTTATAVIYGNDGSDRIDLTNFTGASTIYGGNSLQDSVDGADQITGGSGADLIYGNGGDDVISGGGGADTIIGGLGNNILTGGAGTDTFLVGPTANDTITDYVAGTDQLIFQGAAQAASVSVVGDNTIITLADGTSLTLNDVTTPVTFGFDGNGDGVADNLPNSISDDGTNSSETLTAGNNGDTLTSNGGNDVLVGGTGNDTFVANFDGTERSVTIENYQPADHVQFNTPTAITLGSDLDGPGNTTIGTDGTDLILNVDGQRLVLAGGADGARISVTSADGSTGDFVYGSTANGGVETIAGTAGNDFVSANAGNDTVNAGAGDDVVYGNAGNDTLNGEAGNDMLFGGSGNDVLSGGAGNDTIFGSVGADVLSGGEGADKFVYVDTLNGTTSASDSNLSSGADTITDFGTDDTIDLSQFFDGSTVAPNANFTSGQFLGGDFTATAATDTAISAAVDGAFTATAGVLQVVQVTVGNTSYVVADLDNSGDFGDTDLLINIGTVDLASSNFDFTGPALT